MLQQPFASPGEALAHYGVKGMRWGVRKADQPSGEVVLSKTLDGGGKLVVRKKTYEDTQRLYRLVNSKKRFDKDRMEVPQFIFTNKEGQKVGEGSFYRSGPKSLELEWIGVDKAYRRQGYARGAMEGVITYAKKEGITELNLTATSQGRPLYESLGFKKTADDIYQLKIPVEIKHADTVGGFSTKQLRSLIDYIAEALKDVEETSDELHQSAMKLVADVLNESGDLQIR